VNSLFGTFSRAGTRVSRFLSQAQKPTISAHKHQIQNVKIGRERVSQKNLRMALSLYELFFARLTCVLIYSTNDYPILMITR
jgi:hypothetical protein